MSVFGFSTESSAGGSGEFMAVLKYDARAGRIFRVDRDNAGGEWATTPVDITRSFKAVMDLENLETGWMDFNTGGAPVFALAKIGDPLPNRPTPKAKNGVRVILKLSKDCGGDKPIREMSSSAKVSLQGLEALYVAYQAEKAANPDKLPVVILEDTLPIVTKGKDKDGNTQTTTNYQPVFKITGWAPRGDLVWSPKNGAPTPIGPTVASAGAPDTGSTRVEPPKAKQMETVDDDFG
jgi:hypothetical protein